MPAIPSEEEWLEAMARAREEADRAESVDLEACNPPIHPVPQLQGPFEESIIESYDDARNDGIVEIDAQTRRDQVLADQEYERLCGRRWRQKPGERYHPLWKIIAQITFGMHLLAKGLAKSESDVLKILQSHVAEFDGFIERTTEDFVLARNDIRERLKFLRLPLENLDVFDGMLEDRWFRRTVIEDNERIEHIIERSAAAMNDSFKDIKKGIDSVHALRNYLEELGKEWDNRPRNLDAVYEAMIGNVDGWEREFDRLQKKGYSLAFSLAQLSKMVSEMQRRVGVASRKSVIFHTPNTSRESRARSHAFRKLSGGTSNRSVSEKPLPSYPQTLNPAIAEAVPPQVLEEKLRPRFPVVKDDATSSVQRDAVPNRTRSLSDTSRQRRASVELPLSQKTTTVMGSRASRITRENSYPDDMPAATTTRPASAPSVSHEARRHSSSELETNVAQGKSPFRMALEPFVQLEKRKFSAPTTREDRRVNKLLHRSKSRTFDLFGLSGTKEQVRERPQSGWKCKQFGIFRSKPSTDLAGTAQWSDSERGETKHPTTLDHHMTWTGMHETYTFKPSPSDSPQFPHLIFVVDSPDQDYLEEELKDDSSIDDEGESRLTALPSLGPPLVGLEDDSTGLPSGNPIRDESTSGPGSDAQLASSKYSNIKNQNSDFFKISNFRVFPNRGSALELSDSIPRTGSNGHHVVHQNRHWPVKKPSLFSLRSSRKGSEAQSSVSAESSMSDLRSKPPSAGVTPPGLWSTQARIPSSIDECPSPRSLKPLESESSRARLGLGINIGIRCDPDDLYSPASPPPPGPGGRVMVSPNYGAETALKGEKHEKYTKFRTAIDAGARRLLSPKRSLKKLLHGASLKETTCINNNTTSEDRSEIQDQPHNVDRTAKPSRIKIRGGSTNGIDDEKFHYHGMEKDGTWVTR
ncbi:hypothetical protein VTN96DRAFT_1210 [Rasamsonia emersonii]